MDNETREMFKTLMDEQKQLMAEQRRQGDLMVQLIERVSIINNDVAKLSSDVKEMRGELANEGLAAQVDKLSKDVAVVETVAYHSALKLSALELVK